MWKACPTVLTANSIQTRYFGVYEKERFLRKDVSACVYVGMDASTWYSRLVMVA